VQRLEVVQRRVAGNLLADQRALHVRVAEVDACPDSRFDQLPDQVGEPAEWSLLSGEAAAGREAGELVRADVHTRTAAVTRCPGFLERRRRAIESVLTGLLFLPGLA
jgi:hypothetical protein